MRLHSITFIAVVTSWLLGLLGCASTSSLSPVPPTQAPLAIALSPTADKSGVALPVATLSPTTQSVVPTPTATRTRLPTRTPPAVAQCQPLRIHDPEIPLPLPNLATLEWEPAIIDGQQVRVLRGLQLLPTGFTFSPDNTQVATAIQPYASLLGAMALLDWDAPPHTWLNEDTFLNLPLGEVTLAHWLPTNEPIWVDESGMVSVGEDDSHLITPPVPMLKVAFVVDTTAFVISRDERKWWRLDTKTETWELVQPADTLTGMGEEDYSALSTDKSYIFMLRGTEVWRIPTNMGADAEKIEIESYDVVGSGQAPPPPIQFGTTPYWLIQLPIHPTELLTLGTRTLFHGGFVIDLRDGSMATPQLLAIPAPYDFVLGFTLSADRQWVAMAVVERASAATDTPAWATYVAPTDDLRAGHLIENVEAITILENPATLVLREVSTGLLRVHSLPLTDSPPRVLENTKELLATTTNRLYARPFNDPTRILAFDAQGNPLTTLALSPPYNGYSMIAAMNEIVLVTARYPDSKGDCLYDIVEWKVP